MGRRIVVMKLICSLGHCECDGHTVHKLSQQRLTADLLVPQESDCSRIRSKVSSDRLPSYIKATRPVLELTQNGWILSGQTSYVTLVSSCRRSSQSIRFIRYSPGVCDYFMPVSGTRLCHVVVTARHRLGILHLPYG